MTEFKESGLIFHFDDRWRVSQLDKEPDYDKVCRAVPGTRSIDFIGYDAASKVMLFMEVKGFRGYGNKQNLQRLTGEHDDLTAEIAQKVRDSLSVLMGGARNSTHKSEVWQHYVNYLRKNEELKVVAWVELDVSTEVLLERSKVNMSVRRKALRKRLTWLTSDVQVMNTRNCHDELPGITVGLSL